MSWDITISNIAGIKAGNDSIEPGINAIRGTNWQGKSSFVTAVETAMGTEAVLTEGESRGKVELETDAETCVVELVRENGTVSRQGSPLLTDEQVRVAASLYSFLDDDNEVRRAVRNGENLESVLTRPLDFENIDEQIADRNRERNSIETELERAEDAANRLPTVQQTVHSLESELEDLEERRDELTAERGSNSTTSTHRDELSDLKAERDSVANRITQLERSIERTREKLEDRRTDLSELSVPEPDADLDQEIADTEERYTEFERNAELLQSIYAPTKRILDENRLDLITEVEHDIMADTVSCWICGNETTKEELSENLSKLSEKVSELRAKAEKHRESVEELRTQREEYNRASRREADLEEEIADLESKRDERESSLKSSRERLDDLESRIDELSDVVEETDDELTNVESEIKYTESKLEDAQKELTSLETSVAQRDQLQERYDALTREINELRDRKETLKKRTREAFDDAVRDVLSRFTVGFEMVRLTSSFDLVVARDGREASLDALSEGELELVGIVACLAGYEAFDVTDDVPIMLLDGLGGLADENLQTLIEYLDGRVEHLLFTTYPENTEFEGNTIDPQNWTVVSSEVNVATEAD